MASEDTKESESPQSQCQQAAQISSTTLEEHQLSQRQPEQEQRQPPPSQINEVKKKKKSLRRSFSIPQNPFRLSKRVKCRKDNENNGDKVVASDCNESIGSINGDATTNDTLRAPTTITTTTAVTATADRQQQHTQREQDNKHRSFLRSAWKKFLSRIAQQLTSSNIGAKQSATADQRVPLLGGCVWPPDQVPGVTGLKNHGNTCFMNAVLQCLSHTDILAEYFVLDQYKADLKRRNKINSRKFGTKGELTEQLALVLKALWTCKNEFDYSTTFKAVVDRYGSQFRSSTQHDAQEFLFWLLDKVHEDLNTASKRKYKSIKNNYGRPDEVIAAETLANHIRCNNSFVQAVFQAQFRSSLSCPRCHKQSNTFDPFHCISVQLPQVAQQPVFVTVLYATQHPRQVKLGLSIPAGSPIAALREQLYTDTGISSDRMVLVEMQDTGFVRVFSDSHSMSLISREDQIYCIEVTTESTAKNSATKSVDTTTNLTLIVANVKRLSDNDNDVKRFGTPFCIQVNRDISYSELQKRLLKEMQTILKSDIFAFTASVADMFKIRLQDPSADPNTYIEPNVEHPLFTEMIDLALSVLPADAGPQNVKLLLEWNDPDQFFCDTSDPFVEHESVSQLEEKFKTEPTLTLEQCLEHYTKAETLSAEDAWRCPHCQQYLPVVKTLGLWSLPNILVIHFKRFRQQHIKGPQSAKVTTTVTFPLTEFDMSPHMARQSLNGTVEDHWSPWKKLKRHDMSERSKNNRYDLYAVCYHQGDTLETGHYTAACKNPYDQQWYKFDDQKVNVVPADQVPTEIVNNEAYILFYQRRKSSTIPCSGSHSTSSDHWASKITPAPNTNSRNASVYASVATLDSNENKENSAPIEIKTTSQDQIKCDKDEACSKSVSSLKDGETKQIVAEINITPDLSVKIEPTNEDEIVDVEGLDLDTVQPESLQKMDVDSEQPTSSESTAAEPPSKPQTEDVTVKDVVNKTTVLDDIDIELELRNVTANTDDSKLSTSFPTQRSLWPFDNSQTIHTYTPILNRGSLNFSEMLSKNINHDRDAQMRHSLSTSLYRSRYSESGGVPTTVGASDNLSLLRGVSSCSKDTLIYIDQQNHRSLMNEDTDYMGNQSLWISPVRPHKLITVSPKN